MLLVNFAILHNLGKAWDILHSSKLVFAICFGLLILSALFFFNPEFLYGFVPYEKVAGLVNVEAECAKSKSKLPSDELKPSKSIAV